MDGGLLARHVFWIWAAGGGQDVPLMLPPYLTLPYLTDDDDDDDDDDQDDHDDGNGSMIVRMF